MVIAIELSADEELALQTINRQENQRRKNCFRNKTNTQLIIGIGVLICIAVSLTCLAVVLAVKYQLIPGLTCLTVLNTTAVDLDHSKRFVTREQWKARKGKDNIGVLMPVPYVIIHQTLTDSCTTLIDCEQQIRRTQDVHIDDNRWSDISFNFIVGGDDGYVFEGRGWTKLPSQFGHHYEKSSVAIAFVGGLDKKPPSNESLSAVQELIKTGVENNYIKDDYKLFLMRLLLSNFRISGRELLDVISTWPHWAIALSNF